MLTQFRGTPPKPPGVRRRPRLIGALAALALALAPALPGGTGAQAATAPTKGYWFVAGDGGIFSFGDASFAGSTGDMRLNQPIVGMASSPTGRGYWFVAADGGIFSFGDAKFFGSTGDKKLNRPIVGMAPSPTGRGYWFVAADGGIFSFGDAPFYGSTGAVKLAKPIVGMAATPTGKGYWFVASDGGIFNYGDAKFFGSAAGRNLRSPVVGMASSPTGQGYWLVAADGTVVPFGDAAFKGSMGGQALKSPVVGLAPTSTGAGYWLVAADGGIFSFGDAEFFGSTGALRLNRAIVGMAAAPQKTVGGNTNPGGGGTNSTLPGGGGTNTTLPGGGGDPGPGTTTTTIQPNPDVNWGPAGATSVLARASTGGGTAFRPWMNGDGRYLVFDSDGTKVCGTGSQFCPATTDTAKIRDVYLYDRISGSMERISQGVGGARAAVPSSCSAICGSQRPTISADGKFVAFWSNATNLVPGDTNNKYDAFLFNRETRTMHLVSKGFQGAQADGDSGRPVVSRDGRVVAFESAAKNLIAPPACGLLTGCKGGDQNNADDVFLYDVASEAVSLVSGTADGATGGTRPSLSGNGRKVAYQSSGKVLIRDMAAGISEVASGRSPSLSYDGRFVSFDSDGGLANGDTGSDTDVYLKDLATGAIEQISVPNGGGQATCNACSAVGSDSSISADGRFVAFWSDATGLVPNDDSGHADVFVRDRQLNTLTRMTSTNGNPGDGDSYSPALSLDGRFVAFDSKATTLDPSGGSVGGQDIFVHVNF
jgi:Tol biopolymer transport system component/ribosomal protein L24E